MGEIMMSLLAAIYLLTIAMWLFHSKVKSIIHTIAGRKKWSIFALNNEFDEWVEDHEAISSCSAPPPLFTRSSHLNRNLFSTAGRYLKLNSYYLTNNEIFSLHVRYVELASDHPPSPPPSLLYQWITPPSHLSAFFIWSASPYSSVLAVTNCSTPSPLSTGLYSFPPSFLLVSPSLCIPSASSCLKTLGYSACY